MTVSALAFPAFPEVSLPDLDGTFRPVIEAPPGARTLVAVGHSDCGTTRLLLPYVQRLHARRGPGSSVVLALQDDAVTARALLKELDLDLPVRLEPEPYALSRELGLSTVPTLFLVSPAGLIEHRSEGFQRAAIEDLAQRLGAPAPFFLPADSAPALRPG
jgi:hypothetical protein